MNEMKKQLEMLIVKFGGELDDETLKAIANGEIEATDEERQVATEELHFLNWLSEFVEEDFEEEGSEEEG